MSNKDRQQLENLLEDIRNCHVCQDLPLGPNPVVRASLDAKILIAGQAPGTKVHKTSIPFNDPSGDRLRNWMGIDKQTFYDETKIAIIPMGFCYPGKGTSGDLPPRAECQKQWHGLLLKKLPNIELILAIGKYAQAYHLPSKDGETPKVQSTLTATVKAWQVYLPRVIPLPHPSPRNNLWLAKNPWFEVEVLPVLKLKVAELLLK